MTDTKLPMRPRRFLKYLLCEFFGSVRNAAHQLGIHYNRLSSYCSGACEVRRPDLRKMAKGMKVTAEKMDEIIEK